VFSIGLRGVAPAFTFSLAVVGMCFGFVLRRLEALAPDAFSSVSVVCKAWKYEIYHHGVGVAVVMTSD